MKTMSYVPVVLSLALSTVFAAACGPKVNDPADVQAVTQTVEAYGRAVNAGDADATVAMMTDQTIYADIHFPVAVGKAAVRAMSAAQYSQFTSAFQVPVDEVRVDGDHAVARGTWTITLTPKTAELAPIHDGGSWMLMASRQADGSWKWDAVVPNSDQPLPGTTADGAEEQALLQIERDWAAAMLARDAATVDKLVAKEWTFTNDGQVTPRAQFLSELKSGTYKFESFTMRDAAVRVFGDAALVTMVGDVKGTYKGTDISSSARGTDFFVMRDGRWQCVSTQNATIKP
jgi:uncharacterized protein (TIGR02246 family)